MGKRVGTVEVQSRPFGWRDKIAYGLGDFGCNMSFSLISGYMLLFYTQYVGISLIDYGFIILLTKVWDGINDPIMGAIIDRTRPNKKGDKFKQWIRWGSIPLSVGGALVFFDSSTWSYGGKIAACIIFYLIFDVAYTIVNVPYGSLNSVITSNSVERSQLSLYRGIGALLAYAPIAAIVPTLVYRSEMVEGKNVSIFQGSRMWTIALAMGIIALIAFQIMVAMTTERIKHKAESQEKFNYLKTLKSFVTNRSILAVSLGAFIQLTFILSTGSTMPLIYQMYFGDGKLSSLSVFTALLPTLVIAPFVTPLVRKFGKKNLSSWPFLIAGFIYLFLTFVDITNPYLFVAIITVAGITMAAYGTISWALVSDGVDAAEYKTGRREEGSIYATYSLVRKLAQGVSQAMIPWLIAAVIPGLVMSDPTTYTREFGGQIKNLAMFIPTIGCFLAFLNFRFLFDLDNKKLKEIQAALGRDQAEISAEDVISGLSGGDD